MWISLQIHDILRINTYTKQVLAYFTCKALFGITTTRNVRGFILHVKSEPYRHHEAPERTHKTKTLILSLVLGFLRAPKHEVFEASSLHASELPPRQRASSVCVSYSEAVRVAPEFPGYVFHAGDPLRQQSAPSGA